jgi:hypothetical protein
MTNGQTGQLLYGSSITVTHGAGEDEGTGGSRGGNRRIKRREPKDQEEKTGGSRFVP